MSNEYDEQAAKLLPCNQLGLCRYGFEPDSADHGDRCPVRLRLGVASALRTLAAERDNWRKAYYDALGLVKL